MESDVLTLQASQAELALAPALGGSVLHWRRDGAELLRPASDRSIREADPLGFAAFPLVPFSGRIEHGRFEFEGERVRLPANFPPEPHAIHGHGWQSPWQVAETSPSSASLRLDWPGGAWPWTYRATQRFALEPDALQVELTLTNTSSRPMPGGLGWHPYFERLDATLQVGATAIWRSTNDDLALRATDLDPACDVRTRVSVDAIDVDHCFDVPEGEVLLAWPSSGRTLRITAEPPLRHVVLYTPAREDSFCVEPVSHVPNAVNSLDPAVETGLRVLRPGESLVGRLRVCVVSG